MGLYGPPPAPAAQPGPSVLSSVLSVPSVPPTLAVATERTKKKKVQSRVKDEDTTYKREKAFNIRQYCGQLKLKETGRKGFKGYNHCPSTTPPKRQRRGRTSSRAQTCFRPHSLEGICLRPGWIFPLNYRQILEGSNTVHH
ncbi:hypothetical protein PoB_007348500 [Plakobranchus ocellatus]|uniref:Uncharacterized protein n=1 Tax=Plakobranchus ocellatus TaxID=259542 RepID=A0AAV4DSI0_9GAST|nr:hypothetical protein PoB_007348500 [Plakobranchus ocellatus]